MERDCRSGCVVKILLLVETGKDDPHRKRGTSMAWHCLLIFMFYGVSQSATL